MLDAEQMAELLKAIQAEEQSGSDPIACAAIRVVFWTGWRIGEVLGLEWANLDLDNGVAKLLKTKTAEEEYRQLPAEAVNIVEGLSPQAYSRWVFPGRNPDEHLESVRKPWSKIRKRAKLDNLEGLASISHRE